MKAYKLKEAFQKSGHDLKAGRLLIDWKGEAILIATPTEPTVFIGNYFLHHVKHSNLVDEVELEDEVKIHPHLYKPIKQEINKLFN